jgi:autophagy-related protein 18
LASSSEKGTVIRVFSLPDGEKQYEFRRGSYSAKIYSISFNMKSSLMAVSSDTETVHIFKLSRGLDKDNNNNNGIRAGERDWENGEDRYNTTSSSSDQTNYDAIIEQKRNNTLRKKSFTSITKGLAGGVSNFLLPSQVTNLFDPQRDFAFLKLPVHGVKSIVGISSTSPQIMVVTSEGLFYNYQIDLEKGGECILQKSYSLLDGIDNNGHGGSNSSASASTITSGGSVMN